MPLPELDTDKLDELGFVEPTVADRTSDDGLTAREGDDEVVTVAYAEMGDSCPAGPGDHVAGSEVRFV